MQAPQNTPPPNFGILILLGLCVWAAMKDRAYKKAGGIRPDKFEKVLLLATTVGCILVIFAIATLRSPGAAGAFTPLLVVAGFGAWEIYRYRIRKKNPAGGIPK